MADTEGNPFRFDDPVYVLCEGPAEVRLATRLLRREKLEGFSVNYAQGYERFARHVRGLRTSSDWRNGDRCADDPSKAAVPTKSHPRSERTVTTTQRQRVTHRCS